MSTFKRDSIDVVETALRNEKDVFVQKMSEVYTDQSKGILVMHYNAILKKYSFNDKGSIINTETKQLLTQAKTEWINEDESQEEGEDMPEIVDKPTKKAKKVISEKVIKQPKVKAEKVAKAPKTPKEKKPKKEKVEKTSRVLKYGDYPKKFAVGNKVAFFIEGVENTGVVNKEIVRTLNKEVVEIVFITNDDATKNLDKVHKSNIVNAKKVRHIDGEYDEVFKAKSEKPKKEKKQRILKYAELPLKFNKGDMVAFKLRTGGETSGKVIESFNRIMRKSNGENEVFNHLCIDINGIPNYKKSVYVRAYPDGEYEQIPEKHSGRKPKEVITQEIETVENTANETVVAEEVLAPEELVEA